MRAPLCVFLGVLVTAFLNTSSFGEEVAGTPVSLRSPPYIQLVGDRGKPNYGTIQFGLDVVHLRLLKTVPLDRFREILQVWVGEDIERPQVLGTFQVEETTVGFVPRFALEPNLIHTARINYGALLALTGADSGFPPDFVERVQLRQARPAATTVVSHIYPSGDVPENLLRFYIHFSAPMSRGGVYDHIALVDSDGTPVEQSFLELEPELWDGEARRLTLLFDPGRIKRGLKPRSDLGSALQAGHRYTLRIEKELEDAKGIALSSDVAKSFTVSEADRKSPDVDAWTITAPKAGTRDTLFVGIDEPVDHALLGRMLEVLDQEGEFVNGDRVVGSGEQTWIFIPDEPWKPGSFVVRADVRLEDRAGNRLDVPFDREITERDDPLETQPFRHISFVVK